MGYGDALIWAGAAENVKHNIPDALIYLIYKRSLKSLKISPPSETAIFLKNPTIQKVIYFPSLEFFKLFLKKLFFKNIVFIYTFNKNNHYSSYFSKEKNLFKKNKHAIEIASQNFKFKTNLLQSRLVISEEDEQRVFELLKSHHIEKKGYIVIRPFCNAQNTPNRQWREEKWQECVEYISKQHGVKIIEIGDPGEPSLKGTINLNGLHFFEKAALIKHSMLLTTYDNAYIHIANAFNVPHILIQSSWMPSAIFKYPNTIQFYNEKIECKNCGLKTPCPKQVECIDSISTQDVTSKINELFENH